MNCPFEAQLPTSCRYNTMPHKSTRVDCISQVYQSLLLLWRVFISQPIEVKHNRRAGKLRCRLRIVRLMINRDSEGLIDRVRTELTTELTESSDRKDAYGDVAGSRMHSVRN